MFHSLYITTENGVCIFAKHFLKKSKIDDQLISGFINALGSFATEALGAGMQSLKLQTGEQLAILKYSEKVSLIGIVIADPRDNLTLIRKLLLKILTDFYTIFRQKLETKAPNVKEFEEFRFTVDSILEGKVSARTNFKMIIGFITGLLVMGLILLLFVPAIIRISQINIAGFGLPPIDFSDNLSAIELQTLQTITLVIIVALMGFSCIIFLLPTFLAAYIAGNTKRGIWTALLLGTSVGILLLIGSVTSARQEFMDVNVFLWYLAFSPLLVSLSLLCGMYGGRLKERRKLYPLAEYSEKIL